MMDGNANDYEPAESETPPCPIGAYYRARVQERPASYTGDEPEQAMRAHKRLQALLPARTVGEPPASYIKQGGRMARAVQAETRNKLLALNGKGLTRYEIAKRVGCSMETVRYHLGVTRNSPRSRK